MMADRQLTALPEPYEYSPLANPSDEIRIVLLSAGLARLSDGQKVPQASLYALNLAARPPYSALSYCWGKATDTRVMLLDGKTKCITRNLADYLIQQAQDMQRLGHQECAYWIDAMSINQGDNEEKSHQVQIMGQIFSSAYAVEAWLGPETTDSPAAFQCMEEMSKIVVMPDREMMGSHLLTYVVGHVNDRIIPLHNLLIMDWWQRVWIQQEVALNTPDMITLVCGRGRIGWEVVANVFHCFQLLGNGPDPARHRHMSRDQYESLARRLVDMSSCMMAYLWQHPQQQAAVSDPTHARKLIWRLLINMILEKHAPRATFPIDYLYGILGIISDKGGRL